MFMYLNVCLCVCVAVSGRSMGSDVTGLLVPKGYLPHDLRAIEVSIFACVYMYICKYICIYVYIYMNIGVLT